MGQLDSTALCKRHKLALFNVGAALAANTGAAGAIHRVACFAGSPAPTGTAALEKTTQYLWSSGQALASSPASTLALPIGACSSRKYATAEHNATPALIMNAVVNDPEYWMLKPVAIGATEPAI